MEKYLAQILVVGGLLLGCAALWAIPKLQVYNVTLGTNEEKRANLENEFRKTFAQIVAGLLIIIGFYFSANQLIIASSKDINDRYYSAIGQLSNKAEYIQIGGLLSLSRLMSANDLDIGDFQSLLIAFIRENGHLDRTFAENVDNKDDQIKQSVEVALGVLSLTKQSDYQDGQICNNDKLINLEGTQLSKADLRNVNLTGIRLSNSRFHRADLSRANLQCSFLLNADFEKASLKGANLRGANLRGANLYQADLSGANLLDAAVDRDQLRLATIDNNTRIPDDAK